MYLKYFGLAEAPFSIAPDPRYLYMSKRHQEALAHLLYGLKGDGGFVLLTGEIGAGKTTVCRCLLEQIPDTCDVAYIFNPRLTAEELLAALCTEFGVACPPGNTSIKVFIDCLNAYLLDAHARGRHTVLIIDEAQNLSIDVLEQMRLLTNLETNRRKLLQIVLLGQPELVGILERPELRQLAQRIVARYHLGPLNKEEVAAYVRHRLEVSGMSAARQLFPDSLIGPIYRLSGGVPRVLNVLCDRALLGAFAQGKERVDRSTLAQAAREVLHQPQTTQRRRAVALAALLALLAAGVALMANRHDAPAPVTEAVVAASPAKAPPPATEVRQQAAAVPEVLAWPSDEARVDSRQMALSTLFKAWDAQYKGPDSCRQVAQLGLTCRTGRGNIKELRQMNLPAVLTMHDGEDGAQDFFATLVGLDGKNATFTVGGKVTTVALTALADQWSGQYFLLWRKPPEAGPALQKGAAGSAVSWLDRQLALSEGRAVARNPVFDDTMIRRIRRFQMSQDLEPDGTVGPKTLIRLAAVGDEKSPKLAGSGR